MTDSRSGGSAGEPSGGRPRTPEGPEDSEEPEGSQDSEEPDVPDSAWQSLLDEEHAAQAARARSWRRHLHDLDITEAGLLGTLWDLAEARANVVVHTTAGRCVTGVLTTVGADFCTVTGQRRTTHVPLAALAMLRPEPTARTGEAAGVRERPTDLPLRDVLAELAASRATVTLVLRGLDSPLTGTLTTVGRDLLTLLVDEQARERRYVSLDALLEVGVFGSG